MVRALEDNNSQTLKKEWKKKSKRRKENKYHCLPHCSGEPVLWTNKKNQHLHASASPTGNNRQTYGYKRQLVMI